MNVAKFAKRGLFLASLLSITAASAFAQSAISVTGGYSEGFDDWTAGPVVDQLNQTWAVGWDANQDDASYITNINQTAGNVLALNTEGQTLQANLDGADFQDAPLYVDAMVKFVISEDDPASIPADVKIAFWLNASSNLVAYHGYDNGEGSAPTTTVFTATELDPAQFYRLTIETDYDSDAGIAAFKVYLDGTALPGPAGVAYGDDWADDFSHAEPAPGGEWFLSASSEDRSEITALAFQGTGMIDDLAVSAANPIQSTWTLTLGQTTNGGFTTNGVAAAAGSYTFAPADQVIVAAVADNGYVLDTFTSNTVAIAGSSVTFSDIAAGETIALAATFALHTTAVGIVDNGQVTYYDTIAEAVAAANDGDVIKIFDDITLTEKLVVDGKTVVFDSDAAATITGQLRIVDGADVTIGTNVTFTSSSHPTVFIIGDKSITPHVAATDPTKTSKLTVYGSVLNTNPGFDATFTISGNGSDDAGADIVVAESGLVQNANGIAIYQPEPGSITVDGTVIGASAISIKDGTLTINDGAVITATLANGAAYVGNNNGDSPTGDAIIVPYYPAANGYGTPVVNISGGTITVADTTNCEGIQAYDFNGVQAPEDAASNVNVSGGTFNTPVAPDYCAPGFQPDNLGGGQYGVTPEVIYVLTYVTANGVAPDAVSYSIMSNDFALAAAPVAEGYTFLGWVIGDVTNAAAATFVVADHLENTTATAAWEGTAPADPYPNSVKIDNDFVIVSPTDQAGATLEFGAPTIGATTVTVPFDATLVGSANGLTGLYLKVKYDLLSADFATIPATITAGGSAGTATFSLSDLPQNAAQVFFFGFTTEAIQ